MLSLVFVAGFFLMIQEIAHSADPCLQGNHRIMENAEPRSAAYTAPSNQHSCCDRRLVNAWYRVQSANGGDMPTSCVPEGRCGTIYPLWLNGSIPAEDGREHDRIAAMRYEDDCIFSTYNIKVKNCGAYRVYYLSALTACPAAYCFGDQVQDPKVDNWCYVPTTTTTTTTTLSTTKPATTYQPSTTSSDVTTTEPDNSPEPPAGRVEAVWIVVIVALTVSTLAAIGALVIVVLKRNGRVSTSCSAHSEEQPPPYSYSEPVKQRY